MTAHPARRSGASVWRPPRPGLRFHDSAHILLPEGYVAEVVATGLNAPVHCTFDDDGFCDVSECGHKIESKPRIVRSTSRLTPDGTIEDSSPGCRGATT